MLTTDTGGKSLSVSLTTPNINHHPIIRKQPISYLNKVFTGLLRPYLNTILHIEYLKNRVRWPIRPAQAGLAFTDFSARPAQSNSCGVAAATSPSGLAFTHFSVRLAQAGLLQADGRRPQATYATDE